MILKMRELSSVCCVTNVQIDSETDDIIGLGPGPDQWSQEHQRDFQDFDKNRKTACRKYRDINGDDARRYLETGRG